MKIVRLTAAKLPAREPELAGLLRKAVEQGA